MLNLDTHILIWAVLGKLKPKEENLLRKDNVWCISDIVLWEITKLKQLGRIDFDLDTPKVVELLKHITVIPIDAGVCQALKTLDFKNDPADEIIAATSLSRKIPLLTRDRTIRKSKIVPLVRM